MAWTDERDTSHFHELVKGCGLVVAVVGEVCVRVCVSSAPAYHHCGLVVAVVGEVPTLLALLVQVYTY
jgi:hypothetical protein